MNEIFLIHKDNKIHQSNKRGQRYQCYSTKIKAELVAKKLNGNVKVVKYVPESNK